MARSASPNNICLSTAWRPQPRSYGWRASLLGVLGSAGPKDSLTMNATEGPDTLFNSSGSAGRRARCRGSAGHVRGGRRRRELAARPPATRRPWGKVLQNPKGFRAMCSSGAGDPQFQTRARGRFAELLSGRDPRTALRPLREYESAPPSSAVPNRWAESAPKLPARAGWSHGFFPVMIRLQRPPAGIPVRWVKAGGPGAHWRTHC